VSRTDAAVSRAQVTADRSVVAADPAVAATGPPAPPLLRDPLLVAYLFLVVSTLLPARLIVGPLGGLGAPAVILIIGSTALYGLALLLPGTLAGGFQPVRFGLLLYWVAMLVGFGVSQTNTLSGVGSAASLRVILVKTGLVALGLIVADGVRSRQHLDRLISLIVTAGAGVATLGIVQFLTGLAPDTYIRVPGLMLQEVEISVERSIFTRVQATTLHPIEFGVILAVVLPLALHLALHGTTAGPPSRWRWLPVLLILVATPMAVSRSSVLGIAVGGALIAITWSGRLRLSAAVGGVVLLFAMRAAFPGLLGTLRSMFVYAGDDPSVEARTDDYPLIAEMFAERPWLGHGMGSLVPSESFYVDNEYLITVVTTGLLGVTALIVLLLIGIGTGRGVYHHSSDDRARALGQALAAATAVSAVTWTTYDGMGFRFNAGLAMLIIGAAGALWRLEVGTPSWGRAINRERPVIEKLERKERSSEAMRSARA